MTRRGLVTGGAGFIGSHLVDRLLAEGWQVTVVDDLSTGNADNLRQAAASGLVFEELDIRSSKLTDLVASARPEVVFHLAAQASVSLSVRRPVDDASINLLGTVNVLEAAHHAGVRKVVHASSGGAIYGTDAPLPCREDGPKRPDSPYGISKMIAADYFDWYRRTYGLDYTLLALSNVYGPRQDPHGEAGVIAIFTEAFLAGRVPTLFGDGTQTRDFVFVGDVADAFVRAADRGEALLVNVGTGVETTIGRIGELLLEATGAALPPVQAPPRPGDVLRSVVDNSRAAAELGWRPETPLEAGLTATVEWMRRRAARVSER